MKTLWLGLAPPYDKEKWGDVDHRPIIAIEEVGVDSDPLEKLSLCTWIVFTSKTAVALFSNALHKNNKTLAANQNIITVGRATAHAVHREKILHPSAKLLSAEEETAEGVSAALIPVLRQVDAVFWPRASDARTLLRDHLQKRDVPVYEWVLYRTVPRNDFHFPKDTSGYDAVVFTSPSCVKAFKALVGTAPAGLPALAIGPITQQALDLFLNSPPRALC